MYKICHTEESLNRQREMEAGLLHYMQKMPYDKITLSSLCMGLGVPRKTFYRYFPTKEDALLGLIDHTLRDCNLAVFAKWEGKTHFEAVYLEQFFSYWYDQKAFLDVIRDNDLRYLFLDRTTMVVDDIKAGQNPADFAKEQVEYFIAHGLIATVLRWHHFGFRSSPKEMAQVFSQLLHSPCVSIAKLML